jgi:hypothetical protein
MDDQEFTICMLYRLAYGIATDRVEASRLDTLYGRRHQAKGGAADAIEAEVIARVGRPELAALETIREAVADALAGRRPQW